MGRMSKIALNRFSRARPCDEFPGSPVALLTSYPNAAVRLDEQPARIAALRRYDVSDVAADPSLDKIAVILRTVLRTPMVAISLIHASRNWVRSSLGMSPSDSDGAFDFCRRTIEGQTCFRAPNAAEDPDFAANPLVRGASGVRSYLGAPLVSPDGHIVGALSVFDTSPRIFTPEEEALLREFAALIVAQFELRQIASRDSLTGALSRRAIEEAADRELARHRRQGAASALAIFDLDHFKTVNDRYGHAVGDAVLQSSVAAACDVLRDSDSLGRIGGEEFCVLITGAGPIAAMRTIERIRAAISGARVPNRPEIRITASFGAARCSREFDTARDWIAAADASLYLAKRDGRDRCVMAATPAA
jgi:diguanylate cyclase (GGDEF)-like protein